MIGTPQKWRIYTVDLERRVGKKPGKQRPCVVVQPTEFAEAGLNSTVILPLTTNVLEGDHFPLRVRIPAQSCGLERVSEILVDQIVAWDNSLFRKEIGILPEALQERTRQALLEFLDLTP